MVDVDQEVFDRAGCDDVEFAHDGPEVDFLVEQHHIDQGPHESAGLASTRQVAAYVFDAEPLVPQGAHEFELHLLNEFADVLAVLHSDRQRRYVHQHATGSAKHCRGSRRDGDVDQHLLAACHAREVAGERGDHHGCGRGTLGGVGVLQRVDDVDGECRTLELAGRNRGPRGSRQGGAVLGSPDMLGPVLAIGFEAARRAVGLIQVVQGL